MRGLKKAGTRQPRTQPAPTPATAVDHYACTRCGTRYVLPAGSTGMNCGECLYERVQIVPLMRLDGPDTPIRRK